MDAVDSPDRARASTGVDGLDEVTGGGVQAERATLVRGPPGAGKSILGFHFLDAGAAAGETGLYVNLGEPTEYVRQTASEFGLDFGSVTVLDLSPSDEQFHEAETYELFSSAEVESPSFVEAIRDEGETVEPDRVVLDPITEFRYLTPDDHQFRTQILGLLDFLRGVGATVVLTSQAADSIPDDDLQFLADAVLDLAATDSDRKLRVSKFRGGSARRGPHSLTIDDDGVAVWPRLDPSHHGTEARQRRHETEADQRRHETEADQRRHGTEADQRRHETEADKQRHRRDVDQSQNCETDRQRTLSSGIPELDELLTGGLDAGTVTFFSGPTGVGKTTLGLQFAKEAAGRGERSVLFSFEESRRTILDRSTAIGIPVAEMLDRGTLRLVEIGPDELTVDEFTHRVRTEVEDNDTQIVMIDGTRGFSRSLTGFVDSPSHHLAEVGRYLRNAGVTGLVPNEVSQITGEFRATEEGTSYVADNIVILRHVEYDGELRKVIGVLKMRASSYETRIRELEITEHGLKVGEPLTGLRGILTGTPDWDDGE